MDGKPQVKCPVDDSSADLSTCSTMRSTDYEVPFVKQFPPIPGEEELPCIENDYSRAKAYLMQQCLSSGDNLWDHLNEVLEKILVERPKDIGCNFEEFSYNVKKCRFKAQTDHLSDVFEPPRHYPDSQKILQLLQVENDDTLLEKEENDEDENKGEPDIFESFYYFEQGGIALPKEEMFIIGLHLKKLATAFPVVKFRFWGKILGTRYNYYIAETELSEDEMARINMEREEEEERIKLEQQERENAEEDELRERREMALEEAQEREIKLAAERAELQYAQAVKEAKEKGLTEMPVKEELPPWPPAPPIPEAQIKKTIECPPEPTGTGVNKKVYFVCRQLGEEWIQLPDVTPQQIVTARKIKRAFTGDLESEVKTFPSFPGTEKNLLRAQIARISSGTQISPLGFYTFNEEEEDDVDDVDRGVEGKTYYTVNPDFEPVAFRDLIDPTMSFWVHHTQYILEQGRTSWWSPPTKEEENEKEDEPSETEKEISEVGPALLTPLSEDSAMDTIVPWSVRRTTSLYPEHSIAIVRSNLWPGAFAYAYEKKFDNIYIGYGHKFSGNNHSPIPMQSIQDEYPNGPEILEISDPSLEDEAEWREAHKPKETEVEEEEEEVVDRDADDDEDDDDE